MVSDGNQQLGQNLVFCKFGPTSSTATAIHILQAHPSCELAIKTLSALMSRWIMFMECMWFTAAPRWLSMMAICKLNATISDCNALCVQWGTASLLMGLGPSAFMLLSALVSEPPSQHS